MEHKIKDSDKLWITRISDSWAMLMIAIILILVAIVMVLVCFRCNLTPDDDKQQKRGKYKRRRRRRYRYKPQQESLEQQQPDSTNDGIEMNQDTEEKSNKPESNGPNNRKRKTKKPTMKTEEMF